MVSFYIGGYMHLDHKYGGLSLEAALEVRQLERLNGSFTEKTVPEWRETLGIEALPKTRTQIIVQDQKPS